MGFACPARLPFETELAQGVSGHSRMGSCKPEELNSAAAAVLCRNPIVPSFQEHRRPPSPEPHLEVNEREQGLTVQRPKFELPA